MSVVRKARELVDAGWNYEATSRILATEGVTVVPRTISRWANPRQAERDRARNLAYHRERAMRDARFVLSGSTPEYRLEFMRRLDAVGVPYASIAKVCRVVFDADPPTEEQVRYRLKKAMA